MQALFDACEGRGIGGKIPAGGAARDPVVEIAGGRHQEGAVVVVGAATQHLCAVVQYLLARIRKRPRAVTPVVTVVLFFEARQVGRQRIALVRAAGFQQDDPVCGVFGEPARDDAAGRTAADDQVIAVCGIAQLTGLEDILVIKLAIASFNRG